MSPCTHFGEFTVGDVFHGDGHFRWFKRIHHNVHQIVFHTYHQPHSPLVPRYTAVQVHETLTIELSDENLSESIIPHPQSSLFTLTRQPMRLHLADDPTDAFLIVCSEEHGQGQIRSRTFELV